MTVTQLNKLMEAIAALGERLARLEAIAEHTARLIASNEEQISGRLRDHEHRIRQLEAAPDSGELAERISTLEESAAIRGRFTWADLLRNAVSVLSVIVAGLVVFDRFG